MEITSIKINADALLEVGYKTAEGAVAQKRCDSRNPPHAAFADAMRALMVPVANDVLLLLIGQYCSVERMSMKSITLKQVEDRHGDSSTAVKIVVELGGIATADGNARISLPTLYTDTFGKGARMPDTCNNAVAAVVREAQSYVAALDAAAE
jgi:hypothetical protein